MNKNEFFEQIYDDYKDKIYEFIFYKVSNKELAEDLTSDVFISVYKNLHRYDAEKSFITTWLYAIAYNRLKNYYKSRKNNVYSIEYLIEMSKEIHIVKYGVPKQMFATSANDILFDDEEKNRINWTGKAFDVDNIIEILKGI